MKERMAFGIDFGTTNSIAAVWGTDVQRQEACPYAFWDDSEGRSRPHASVVWYSPNAAAVVGNTARANMEALGGAMGHRFIRSIKRDLGHEREKEVLGGQRLEPFEVAAEIFRFIRIHAKNAAILHGKEMMECIVTIPVTFGGQQRKEIRRAVERAGMRLKSFLHEPFAAMISHFYDPDRKLANMRNSRVLVFDWGGGTLDVCIVQLSKDGSKIVELAHDGIEDRAGDDFDQRLMAHLRAGFLEQHPGISDDELEIQGNAKDRFWLNGEAGKIALSRLLKTNITTANFFQKDSVIYDLQATVTRQDFENLISPEVDAAVRCIQRCLSQARLTAGCIDHVLLVGGTSNIPLVRERLEALFGHKVQVANEPDAAIARGAAIVAAEGWRPFNAHSIGVTLSNGSFFDVLKEGVLLDAESSRRVVFYCTDWRLGSANLFFGRKAVSGDNDVNHLGEVLQVPTKREVNHEGDLDRIVADFTVTPDATLRCVAQSSTVGDLVQCEIHDISLGLNLNDP